MEKNHAKKYIDSVKKKEHKLGDHKLIIDERFEVGEISNIFQI
jgi:hypothetical protein